ncbi:MAG: hypothetical protein R3293_28645 [Candidatus Promineifilaceae bacterium]|nr:hypothetical protein [Candidatus Promineifilaceae bacterium]
MSAERYERAYFWAFVSTLVLCWSPINALAYAAPLIAVAVFILLSRSQTAIRNAVIWFLIWGVIIFFYIALTPGFVIHSALLSVVTYSTFLVVLAIPGRFVSSTNLLQRMLALARWIIIFEALVGITQGVYGFTGTGSFDIANGDFVEGTIHPALATERSLSNPMFAINMAFLLVAVLPDLILKRKGFIAVCLGAVALILASVLHVLLMLVVAGVLAILLFWPISLRRRMVILVGSGFVIAAIAAFFVLRSNFGTADEFARQLLSGESVRTVAIQRAVNDMPQDYLLLPLIGLGPGQFSSRAGLIGTGLYFGGPNFPRPVPFLPTGMSKALEENTLDLWLEVSRLSLEGIIVGSTNQPFLSWLSVYVEWGLLVLVAVFGLVLYLLLRARLVTHSYPERVLGASFGTGLLLLLFLGAQENYWEVPQAILVGLMIFKVQFAILMNSEARISLTRSQQKSAVYPPGQTKTPRISPSG